MNGPEYIHTETIHNTRAAGEVLPYVFKLVKPASVIDIGCGTGTWLKIAKKLGANTILGIDGIHADKSLLCIKDEEFMQHDLTKPIIIKKKYDLAICLEVAEHLPEDASDDLIETITGHSDIILFSAALPGQGGQNHINEQWPPYWQKKFAEKGFAVSDFLRDVFWNNNQVDWWYKQNMFIYFKEDVISTLNKTDHIQIKIHPELFEHKMGQIKHLDDFINHKIRYPKFWPALKNLFRSLF